MVDQTIERGAVSCVRRALAGLVLAIHYGSRRRACCRLASDRRLLALKRAGFYTIGPAGEGLYQRRRLRARWRRRPPLNPACRTGLAGKVTAPRAALRDLVAGFKRG
jgi:hypothetical protein